MTTIRLAFILALGLSYSALAAPSTPEASVRAVVKSHFQGIANADRAVLNHAWATDVARITTIDKQKLSSQPIASAFALWTKSPSPDMRYTIESVDLIGDRMATVKATVNWRNGVYLDYLTLMNVDGKWQLTAKHYLTQSPAPITKTSSGGYGAF